MNKEFLVFGRPSIGEEEIAEVVSSLRDGWLGTGPKVAQFEKEFRNFTRSSYSCALSSCTAGLHLGLMSLNLEPQSEVITTPLTFCATVNAIIHAGLKPVLADVDPYTGNIDAENILEKVTDKTTALIPVHLTGYPCNMDSIMDLAQENQLKVVEDCAHAIETLWNGQQVGTIGDLGVFSFYATKNVVTGEGGMVLSRREDLIRKVKSLSLHGMTADAWGRFSDSGYKHYRVVEAGFKYNMMDLQAAIGLHQLRKVMDNWARRQKIWHYYREEFMNLPLDMPLYPAEEHRHAYHLFSPRITKDASLERDEFLNKMTDHGIGVGVHYLSIPEHPYYRNNFQWRPEDYPQAMKIGRSTISLPLSPGLTDNDVDRVVRTVKEILE